MGVNYSVVEVVVVVIGYGLTQFPPGADMQTLILLVIIVAILPHSSPSSGFHEITWAKVMRFLAAMELQVSPDFGEYAVQCSWSGRQMVPEVGNPRQ